MNDPVLLPRQQLAVAARRLPDPSRAQVKKIVIATPEIDTRSAGTNYGALSRRRAESIVFELEQRRVAENSQIPVWRFDGRLFVDHWVEPDNPELLRLFLELASGARAIEILELEGEVARVSAYFWHRGPR
jgi:hypothetical protein